MAIEKKSLISTLRTTKKANVVSSTPSHEAAHTMNKFAPKKPTVKTALKSTSKVVVKSASKAVVKSASKAAIKKMQS